MSDLKWQEPPADGRAARHAVAAVKDELRRNPGRWALIAEDVSPSRSKPFKGQGFEAITRKSVNGRQHDVYARYVGVQP